MIPTETITAICDSIADGKSAREACILQSIDESTFRKARRESEVIRTQYTRACEERAHHWAEEFMGVADDGSNDWMASNDPDNPGYKENGEAIRRSVLRIDARKWMMARILPKQFGDKVDMNLSGEVGVKRVVSDL